MALQVIWSPEARMDVRALDQETALRLLKAIDRFLKNETGDVKQLKGFSPPLFRLRIGSWRVLYRQSGGEAIEVARVLNRSEAYR